ncbi:MAG TPA: hypothetical protein VFE50_08185 [Cyclobacteriaceae bacterium]|nr:hypothetical protein [Cyclobacteriaceae bacterium]
MEIQEQLTFLTETIKPWLPKDTLFDVRKYSSFESGIRYTVNNSTKILHLHFELSGRGLSPSALSAMINIHRLEEFIKPIIQKNGLPYSDEIEYTVLHTIKDRELYRGLKKEHSDEEHNRLLRTILVEEIIPFFNRINTVEDMSDAVAQVDFRNLTMVGGQYPVKFLKAITVAKWCNLESKYDEYKNEFKRLIKDERDDPDPNDADSFQNAFDEVIAGLEHRNI